MVPVQVLGNHMTFPSRALGMASWGKCQPWGVIGGRVGTLPSLLEK